MNVFENHLETVKQINEAAISKSLFDFIRSIGNEMIEMNKKQLNEDSMDIHGKPIGFYSKATEYITDGAKEWGTPFTAKDTGSFLDHFYISVKDGFFFFGSTDPKVVDILTSKDWLSHDLFGLTDNNLQDVINEKFLPFIINFNRKKLGL